MVRTVPRCWSRMVVRRTWRLSRRWCATQIVLVSSQVSPSRQSPLAPPPCRFVAMAIASAATRQRIELELTTLCLQLYYFIYCILVYIVVVTDMILCFHRIKIRRSPFRVWLNTQQMNVGLTFGRTERRWRPSQSWSMPERYTFSARICMIFLLHSILILETI